MISAPQVALTTVELGDGLGTAQQRRPDVTARAPLMDCENLIPVLPFMAGSYAIQTR
jgi:hypothetical protein